MITLQDAIERAKLAVDESGILSSYLYDEMVQQLGMDEQYAFTSALVDLGIQTKIGSEEDMEVMGKVIAQDFYDEDEEDEDEEEDEDWKLRVSIIEDFVKVAQQYVQSPGGLWVPEETLQEPEQTDQTFDEQFPYGFPPPAEPQQEPIQQSFDEQFPQGFPPPESPAQGAPGVSKEFVGEDIEQIQETLEKAGMSIDADGNVSLYQQGAPGLYKKQIPLKPMPLEKAIDRLNSEANSVDAEQARIAALQDILSTLNSDFQEIEMDAQNLLEKFDESYNNLEKFRYSEKSTDENIRSIAEGLSSVRSYIEQSSPSLDDFRGGLSEYSGTVQDLQGKLDNYYQTQYTKYSEKIEIIDALERLKDMKDTNPQIFQKAVQGLGGVVAIFLRAQKKWIS